MIPFKIGILGAARIAPKALIDPARVLPTLEVSAIAARTLKRAQSFASKHNISKAFEGYAALIDDDEVDIIYNPLPINAHAEWSIKALEAGKHVICEKPFAMNGDEARAMIAAAQASGKRLIEAFHYRYHPAFEQVLQCLHSDEIGEIQTIDACFNVWIRDSETEIRHHIETGGGAMMDLGCYPLSWVLSILDDAPAAISATAKLTEKGVDESLETVLTFPSGVKATLKTNMSPNQAFDARMVIHGSKGSLTFNNPVAPHNNGSVTLTNSQGTHSLPVSRISTYTYQLEKIVQAIETHSPCPTEGSAILRQQDALDAIYTAAGLKHLRWLE